jgi:uncharacterized OB-fold protein/predicted TIM-barrel fold metal-dependent hydrolase
MSKPYLPASLAEIEVPVIAQGFFNAAESGALAVQSCAQCGHRQHPPRDLCAVCHGDELGWAPVSGRGRVFTYTIVHHPIGPTKRNVPYNVVSVALDEDPEVRIVSNLVDVAPEDVHIGMPVVVVWERVRDDLSVPRFRRLPEELLVLEDDVQLVSVDDHVIEHPNVWRDRLPAALRDRGPNVVTRSDGRSGWEYDGYRTSTIGLNAVAGKPHEERGLDPMRYEDMRPGCYDPVARVRDMDEDGVHVQMCFPDFPGFAGRVFIKAPDKALALLCLQAWNDFILDEWCAAAPDRFIPLVLLPVWDIKASVDELHRTVGKGARAISFLERPDGLGLPSIFTDHWDPLFAAAAEAGTPLCTHFGTGGAMEVSDDRPMAIRWTIGGQRSMTSAAELLFSRTFHKHPALKVCLSEGGIGWMPYLLERADYVWERHRWYQDVDRSVRPSELFRDHVFGCFISDRSGLRDRYAIGVDQIMWESDYPHADSNFPLARKVLDKELAEVPADESRKIAEDNARRVFNFPRVAS